MRGNDPEKGNSMKSYQELAALAGRLRALRLKRPFFNDEFRGEMNPSVFAKLSAVTESLILNEWADQVESGEFDTFRRNYDLIRCDGKGGWDGSFSPMLHAAYVPHTEWAGLGPGDGDCYDVEYIFYNEFSLNPKPWGDALYGAIALYQRGLCDDGLKEAWKNRGGMHLADDFELEEDDLDDFELDCDVEEDDKKAAPFYLYDRMFGPVPKEIAEGLKSADMSYYDECIEKIGKAFGWSDDYWGKAPNLERLFLNTCAYSMEGMAYAYVATFASKQMGEYVRNRSAFCDKWRDVLDDLFEAVTLVRPDADFANGVEVQGDNFFLACGFVGDDFFVFKNLTREGSGSVIEQLAAEAFYDAYNQAISEAKEEAERAMTKVKAARKKKKAATAA